ncbi:hypothetical protein [uncultured Draconibacterium sp.]|uniref:hypothetical protein n=1 Tax=uncultured Draconibacterium sp. TaxID=1573823 RepID=UPI0025F2DD10|nr:hypothetical protein [uncultured Draconibacterium sp.]
MNEPIFIYPEKFPPPDSYVVAKITPINNNEDVNYGMVEVFFNVFFLPITEHPEFEQFMSFDVAERVLLEFGFLKLPDGYTVDNVLWLGIVANQPFNKIRRKNKLKHINRNDDDN